MNVLRLSRSFWRRTQAAPDRQRCYRPMLEHLEDRCLPSGGFTLVNLASDLPGLARVTDPNLVNPWGISLSPTGPFWFADNGSGVSDLLDGRGQPVPLVVSVPSAANWGGTPTGTVFNSGAGFVIWANGVSAPSRFLFASEDGTISGWSALVTPSHAVLAVDNSATGAVYKGLAIATDPAGRSFLYAADFRHGTVAVFDQDFRPVVYPGAFQDPNLPRGFAPFNIQAINHLLFVTYAQQDAARHDSVAGAGSGFIDVYDTSGRLLRRFASQGVLNAPWGLALAPADFGPFGGALLVGNNGDGRISAYDSWTGKFLGQLTDNNGNPIAIPDLWSLTFGNGHVGGDAQTLFFTEGLDYETHGLFGAIQAPGRQGMDTAGSGVFDPTAPGEALDYPLPPSNGPALVGSQSARPVPAADLLPLRDSSLVLVPTLSTFTPPNTTSAVPVPIAGTVGPSGSGFAVAAPPAHAFVLSVAAEHSQPAVDNGAVALNLSFAVDAARQAPPKEATVQQAGAKLEAVATGRSAAAPVAGAADLLAEQYVTKLEPQGSEESSPDTLPPSGQANATHPGAPDESRPASTQEGEVYTGFEFWNGDSWAKLVSVLVVSIPMTYACWLWYERRSRPSLGRKVSPG